MNYKHRFKYGTIDFIIGFSIQDRITPLGESIDISGEIKFDTGSDLTIFPASQIGFGSISEIDFIDWLKEHEKVYSIKNGKDDKCSVYCFSCGGVDSSALSIRSYAYQVDNFTLELDNGSLKLKSVPIAISFDKRFIRPLFGKDLISLLCTEIDTNNKELILSLNDLLKAASHKPIDALYMRKNGYYKPDELIEKDDIDNLKNDISQTKPTYYELLKMIEKLKNENKTLREYNKSLKIMKHILKN